MALRELGEMVSERIFEVHGVQIPLPKDHQGWYHILRGQDW